MSVKTEKDLPDKHKAAWLKAMSAMQLKNYGYTIQLLQPVLKAHPEFLPGRQLARKAAVIRASGKKGLLTGLSTASISVMRASSHLKKDPAGAMEAVEKVLEEEPFNVQANQVLRDAAMALNLPETATFAYETLLEGHPKDTKILHDFAKHLIDTGNPQRAVEIYGKILELTPGDLAAIKGTKDASARASMLRGGWDREESTYRELIKNKDEAVSLEQKSRIVKSDEMIDQQLAEMHATVQEQPDNIDVSRRIGELYEQKGDFGSAVQWYEYAVTLGGNADLALLRRASDLRLKQYDETIAQWEAYIASEPGENEKTDALAQLESIRADRLKVELEEAKKRVDRNPTDLSFRYELGEILLRQGQPQEAIPELQKARQNPNVRLRAMFLLAKCYEAKSMSDLAVKTLSSALEDMPAMDGLKKEMLYQLGLLLEKMGKKEESLEAMKQIYEVDYGYRDVARRVEGSYESDS